MSLNLLGETSYGGLICGVLILISIVLLASFQYLYMKSKKSLITIQFAGGEIAFDINWFTRKEMDDFQRYLRLAKDKATEDAEQVMADKINAAVQHTAQQTSQRPTSFADEIAKYGELLEKGLITQEEFERLKGKLI